MPITNAPSRHSPARLDALRAALLPTVARLKALRAAEIDERDIDDYVALNWMEWNGGRLQLTVTGGNVCQQLRWQVPGAGGEMAVP